MKTLFLICILALSVTAQISVPQSFIDTADKAFQEVIKDREVIAAKNDAITAKDSALAAQSELIQKLKDDVKLRDVQIVDFSKLKCDTTSFFFVIKIKRCH